ncbi:MAG TPA: hypothetical protein PLZ43_07265 [bacterium]|nr:hypothetical protein [bacterium]
MTIYFDITGHELSVGKPLSDVLENGATNILTAAGALDTALGTAVKGTGWTSGMTLKAHDDTVAGHTTTIGAHSTALSKLNGMYSIEFVGADADPDAAFCGTISVLTPGAVPAAGDKIIAVISARVTADMTPVAYPAIVAAQTSDGFVQALALDGATVKVKQGAGSDLDANTYRALVLKV